MATGAAPQSCFDVVIVGGGIAAASLGAEIAGRCRTVIIEAEAQCGLHSTGRSAAFWLESYGGEKVAPLTRASRDFLESPPADFFDGSFLSPRGAVHISSDDWPQVAPGIETRRLDREALSAQVPGLGRQWRFGLLEPGCADIDVAALHSAYLRRFRRQGGEVRVSARLERAIREASLWRIDLQDGQRISGTTIVNAAGAWADDVARRCGVAGLNIAPKRRTMVQLRVERRGLRSLPLVTDSAGTFYFKGEGDNRVWLSPHDEIDSEACDAAPEEIDIAVAIDRFEKVVDWPIEAVERSWAGLRSFAPDRVPLFGFDPSFESFFWCAGQGGFGIQTAPAAARLSAALLLGQDGDETIAAIDPETFSPGRPGLGRNR